MNRKFLKAAALLAALFVVSFAYIAGLHAQQSPLTQPVATTTNWMGYLVIGQNDTVDAISIGGPVPTVARHVQIGLKSDGTLVWRKASDFK